MTYDLSEYLEEYFEDVENKFYEKGKDAMLSTINDVGIKEKTLDLFVIYCAEDLSFDIERVENLSILINNNFQQMFKNEMPNIYEKYEREIDDEIRKMTSEIEERMKEEILDRDNSSQEL